MTRVSSVPPLSVHYTSSVLDVPGLDRLTASSPWPSHLPARLLQLERDPRWKTRYIVCSDESAVQAVVPVHLGLRNEWEDAAYDPSALGLRAEEEREVLAPKNVLVVGSRSDLRSRLLLAPDHDVESLAVAIADSIRGLSRDHNRVAFFPYFDPSDRALLSRGLGRGLQWVDLPLEAQFTCDDARKPSSRVRSVLRRDRDKATRLGLRCTVRRWNSEEVAASAAIADHNVRKGGRDHPRLVQLRMDRWAQVAGVRPLLFTIEGPEGAGYLSALASGAVLDLYEMGLPLSLHDSRQAMYAALIGFLPLDYARENRIARVRCGIGNHLPKHSRGADLTPLYAGRLDTQAAADEVGSHAPAGWPCR